METISDTSLTAGRRFSKKRGSRDNVGFPIDLVIDGVSPESKRAIRTLASVAGVWWKNHLDKG